MIAMPMQRLVCDWDGSILQPMTLANMRENGGPVDLRDSVPA
jgi:hypothetical protein